MKAHQGITAGDSIANGKQHRQREAHDGFTSAIDEAIHHRWRGLRGAKSMTYQARKAAEILRERGHTSLGTVTANDLYYLCAKSLAQGLAHGTVRFRLDCLSAIGLKIPEGFRFKVPKPPKWFMRREDEEQLPFVPGLHSTALHFILWTCATGLRVEESLRTRARYVSSAIIRVNGQPEERYILNVDGTKTVGAQATIVLSEEAVGILRQTGWPNVKPDALIFPIEYKDLRLEWLKVREHLGVSDVSTATLKSLRRSYARRATLKGMPTDVPRVYLRHTDIKTTQGYLNLVGGYSHEEQARFV